MLRVTPRYMQKFPHVNIANKYARDIVSGRIKSCKYTRLACERYFEDLKRNFQYKLDKNKVEKVCRFIELLVHVKGKWADERFHLSPWQCFVVCNIFGWVDKMTGYRRFTEAYIEVPRKNGKSFLASAIALYMFIADGEKGAEVYSGATTETQAFEVFRPAKEIVEKLPMLKKAFGIEPFAKSMFAHSSSSRFRPVKGKPGDGASPHCAIIDEYHQHDDNTSYSAMKTGMPARTQPLLFVITTAGFNLAGPCYKQHLKIQNLLKKSIENDRLFGIIYSIDDEDDWTDIENWKKANPNFGISLYEDFLKQQLLTAMQDESQQNSIRCKHLNEWVSADTVWLDAIKLASCASYITIDSVKHLPCVIGFDMAAKIDIAAVVLLFYDDDKIYTFCRFYLPSATVIKRQQYQEWVFQNLIESCEGEIIDIDYITDDIMKFCSTYDVRGICYDPWQLQLWADKMSKEGLNMIEVRNTVQNFSEPMKELQALIYSKRFVFENNQVLYWMLTNVVAHYDKKDNIFPNKQCNENKIDGAVAIIMALNYVIRLKNSEDLTQYPLVYHI